MKTNYGIYILWFFATTLAGNLYGQRAFWIRGMVTDEQGSAIPYATVYVNNTSFYAVSDSLGRYHLNINTHMPKVELIVSMVGYETSRMVFESSGKNKQVQFILKQSTVLKEVQVTAKRNAFWRRKWRIFEEGLLGASARKAHCTILNPGVVQLDYDEKTLTVKAHTLEPLEVINEHLGYRISVQINYFESDGKFSSLAADKFFDTLQVNSLKHYQRILKARVKTYNNSFRSFLVSLANGNSFDAGFEIFQTREIRNAFLGPVVLNDTTTGFYKWVDARQLVVPDSLENTYVLKSEKPLLVIVQSVPLNNSPHADYPYAYSQIQLPNGSFTFDSNGWLLKPNGLFLHNYWGAEGLASLLPDNYDPFSQKDFLLKTDIETLPPMNKRARPQRTLPEKIVLPHTTPAVSQ